MPKYRNACPPVIEKDIYPHCPFGCVYCVARTQAPPPDDTFTAERVIEKAARTGLPVYLSPWSDAYHPAELREKKTRSLLERLRNRGCSFYVITKSEAVLRDADLFAGYPRSFIAISLNSADDAVSARIEPHTPSASRRLETIASLIALGTVKVVVKIDPILPGVTDGPCLENLLERLIQLAPAAVTAETVRLNRSIKRRLYRVLSAAEKENMDRYYPEVAEEPIHAPLAYRIDLFTSLERRLDGAGIRAAFCRASLPEPINSNDCRGGF